MKRMSTEMGLRPLLKVAEVAERLSISESTVRRLIVTGELPAHRLGAGPQPPVRVDPKALEAWLDQHMASVPKPAPSGAAFPIAGSPRGGLEVDA
jgi:excisionase family DNA binding protein